ncbi:MAG: PDZ domain-containing protein [Bryobacterales bacterium]|nr:PDZ domain-containing protein [Bryobacterales bacterium]
MGIPMSLALCVVLSSLLAAQEPALIEEIEKIVIVNPPAPPDPPPLPERPGSARSYLGIGVAEIDAERAKALKLAEERGVEITRVEPDSPAEKAGLKVGDVVLEYNGQRVEGTQQFMRMVRETPPGRRVTLLISRDGATQTVTATLGRRRDADWPLGPEFRASIERLRGELERMGREWRPEWGRVFVSMRTTLLGVEAESLNEQLAEFFGVKEGVLVRSVLKDTPAEKAGLKAGDVITKVDGETVRSPDQILQKLRSAQAKGTVSLTIVRNRKEMTVNVTLPAERARPRTERPRPRTISVERSVRL